MVGYTFIDYIKLVNEIMAIIFKQHYYNEFMENAKESSDAADAAEAAEAADAAIASSDNVCNCGNPNCVQGQHATYNPYAVQRIYIDNYDLAFCKSQTKSAIKNYMQTLVTDKTILREQLVRDLVHVWIPNSRQIPNDDYFVLCADLSTLILDEETTIFNLIKQINESISGKIYNEQVPIAHY